MARGHDSVRFQAESPPKEATGNVEAAIPRAVVRYLSRSRVLGPGGGTESALLARPGDPTGRLRGRRVAGRPRPLTPAGLGPRPIKPAPDQTRAGLGLRQSKSAPDQTWARATL